MGWFQEDFLSAVRAVLARDGYHAADFEIEQHSTGDFRVLTLTYRFHAGFQLQAQVSSREHVVGEYRRGRGGEAEVGRGILLGVAPGDLLSREQLTVRSRGELLEVVGAWVERIDAELRAIPVNQRAEEQYRQIEEFTREFLEVPAGRFTDAEVDDLRQRLAEFEQEYAAAIRSVGGRRVGA